LAVLLSQAQRRLTGPPTVGGPGRNPVDEGVKRAAMPPVLDRAEILPWVAPAFEEAPLAQEQDLEPRPEPVLAPALEAGPQRHLVRPQRVAQLLADGAAVAEPLAPPSGGQTGRHRGAVIDRPRREAHGYQLAAVVQEEVPLQAKEPVQAALPRWARPANTWCEGRRRWGQTLRGPESIKARPRRAARRVLRKAHQGAKADRLSASRRLSPGRPGNSVGRSLAGMSLGEVLEGARAGQVEPDPPPPDRPKRQAGRPLAASAPGAREDLRRVLSPERLEVAATIIDGREGGYPVHRNA
jgi:hypothetical protein